MGTKNVALLIVPAVALLVLISSCKKAAPPPLKYVCPYCGASFATYEELVAHVQSVHPGERIPLEITWE